MPEPRVILLEFNELTPWVMQRFIDAGQLPHFARLYRESEIFTTDAQEQYPHLEPWIQWVTVHTGLSRPEHGIERLADGVKLPVKRIWDLASDAGRRVWVCGSMNARYELPLRGRVLPDPWSARLAPYPAELAPFYEFVRRNVQEHSNEEAQLAAGSAVAFLKFMLRHGLSPATMLAAARQLIGERFGRPHWQRAAILDRLQMDLFRHVQRRDRPHLATFFLNSTAHLQHRFWRDFEPDRFGEQGNPPRRNRDAILFGYRCMDRLVGQFLDLADEATTLVLCSAMSQQACLDFEASGGKRMYRPKSFDSLLAAAGITAPCRSEATMAEQFRLQFDSAAAAADAAARLKAIAWNGQQALNAKPNDALLYCGCRLHEQLPRDAQLTFADGATRPVFELFYQIDAVKSGKHHPDGIFWIRRPGGAHRVHADKPPLTCVAPTILDLLGVAPPATWSGRSLLSDAVTKLASTAAAPAASGIEN